MKKFTILLISEDLAGMLNRVVLIFTRRHINIQSLTVSTTEIKNVSRYTIVVEETEEKVKKVVKLIERHIEVIRVLYFTDNETVYQEVALYKLSADSLLHNSVEAENILRESGGRIISLSTDFVVVEKTGKEEEIRDLFKKLEQFHILEFVKSGRVAVMKRNIEAAEFLRELEEQHH